MPGFQFCLFYPIKPLKSCRRFYVLRGFYPSLRSNSTILSQDKPIEEFCDSTFSLNFLTSYRIDIGEKELKANMF
jgi:hypothetical protein